MRPLYPSRRSVSNAVFAAAPPPTMTIDAGSPAEGRRCVRDDTSRRPRTKCLPPMVSGNRVPCRGAHGLAGPHAEAGMMPGTTHRVADQQAFREGAAVVRADCIDRKYLVARSGQDYLILSNVAKEHGAISEQLDLDALSEIGAGRFHL